VTYLPGVRERLEKQYRLSVLRLSLVNSRVYFAVSVGGEQLALLDAPAEAMGIPCHINFPEEGDEGLEARQFKLPSHIASSLKSLLCDPDSSASSIWIRLSKPVGLLTAVPWERLLQPLLNIPVLRLPYHLIRPREPREQIDTVICFSSPATEPEVEMKLANQITDLIPSDLARLTNFHLFARSSIHEHLIRLQHMYNKGHYNIIVYPPPVQKLRGNPWFSWISQCLRSRSADVVHFVCHSHRMREEGCLALAESPTPDCEQSATLVSARELNEFLNRIGAWSVSFASPPNRSTAGMLMLQDSVAQLRPGPVLVHDMNDPDSGRALVAAYRFLYQEGQQPPASPAIALYCHPARQQNVGDDDEGTGAVLNQYTLATKLGNRLAEADQPAWLASAQRILESSAGDVAAEFESDPDSGRARARRFIVEALTESADELDPAKGSSAEGTV
jgi:hypothetical protein